MLRLRERIRQTAQRLVRTQALLAQQQAQMQFLLQRALQITDEL